MIELLKTTFYSFGSLLRDLPLDIYNVVNSMITTEPPTMSPVFVATEVPTVSPVMTFRGLRRFKKAWLLTQQSTSYGRREDERSTAMSGSGLRTTSGGDELPFFAITF